MAITYKQYSSESNITPEERQLKNERTRVESMIRAYERNPNNYNPRMVASLERMATQYGVMFNKVEKQASTGQKILAGVGGFADGILMDLIPDSFYSGDETTTIRNRAKWIGTGASFALGTGIAGAAVKGAGKLGTKAAGALATKQAARATAKKSAKEAAEEAAELSSKRAAQGDVGVAGEKVGEGIGQAVGGPGVGQRVRGAAGKVVDDADPEALRAAAKRLEDAEIAKGNLFGFEGGASMAGAPAALSNMARKNIRDGLLDIGQVKGFKWAQKGLSDDIIKAVKENPGDITGLIKNHKLTADQVKDITKEIVKTHKNTRFSKHLQSQIKGAGVDMSTKSDDLLAFINNIGKKRVVNKTNVEAIGQAAKLKKPQYDEIFDLLDKGKVETFDDAIAYLQQSMKSPDSMSILEALNKNRNQLLTGAAQAYGSVLPVLPSSVTPFGGQAKTRRELEEEMYDPMNVTE